MCFRARPLLFLRWPAHARPVSLPLPLTIGSRVVGASSPLPAADDRALFRPGPPVSRAVPRRPDPAAIHCRATTPSPTPAGRGPLPATEPFPRHACPLAFPRSASTRRPTHPAPLRCLPTSRPFKKGTPPPPAEFFSTVW
jgi:hypothetical protein